uniref:G_PROTEIN_RECEP_F1_2 domain-containing protein n=1 Tax=Parastrongyloides trichosuri TaxID=131310 RepID=A0A0N4Z7B5_PARTI
MYNTTLVTLSPQFVSTFNETKSTSINQGIIFTTFSFLIIGLLGNVLMILLILMTRILWNRISLLLGILSFTDIILNIYMLEARIDMLSGAYYLTNDECFEISVYGIFASNVKMFLQFFIAIDRVLAIKYYIFYKNFSSSFYLSIVIFFSIFFGIILTSIGKVYTTDNVLSPVCTIPSAYYGNGKAIWIVINLISSICIICIYSYIWTFVKNHIKDETIDKNSVYINKVKAVLSSLTIIVIIYTLSWFLIFILLLIIHFFATKSMLTVIIQEQMVWLVIINISSNFPVYMWRTDEYRKTFIRLFCFKSFFKISPESHNYGNTIT